MRRYSAESFWRQEAVNLDSTEAELFQKDAVEAAGSSA
jgi:hypothetical protein